MNSSWLCCIIGSDTCACARLNKTTKVSQFWSRCRLSSVSSLFDVGCCWSCPTVRCWNCAFLLFVHFFIRMSHTPPSPTRTSSIPPPISTPPPTPSDTVLEPSQIKKLITMRKCSMTLHWDITVDVFSSHCWSFCFSSLYLLHSPLPCPSGPP